MHGGGSEQIDVRAVGRSQIGTDVIIGRELREGSGTARPLLSVPDFPAGVGVVGIVKRSTVRLNRPCSENGVVKDALHAVAVTRILGDAKQVACDLKMAIGAARRFKAGVGEGEAIA